MSKLVLAALVVCCALAEARIIKYKHYNRIQNGLNETRSKHWDFLMFTQTWPSTSCLIWKMESSKHKCNITCQINSWTVHGIWPSSIQSDDPAFCNKSDPFDLSQILSIKPDLDQYWANVYADTPEDSLWSHEWEKHGTCATILPTLDTQLKFFRQGLKWIQQHNMLTILTNSGIVPSNKTPVLTYDIQTAIKNTLNVMPLLVCNYVKGNKTYYIYEIELCFDKELNLINCPQDAIDQIPLPQTAERCPTNQLVWYPPIIPTKEKFTKLETVQVSYPYSRVFTFRKTVEKDPECN